MYQPLDSAGLQALLHGAPPPQLIDVQGCAFLAQRGFRHLYHLDGGIAAWAGAGLPVG